MDYILHGYSVNEATWFYLSLLLVIAVFFRFNRIWSLRNLDLVLLLSFSPGLLLVDGGYTTAGYSLLFVCTGLFLARLFVDPWFRRRPLLEQNLNSAGLTFLCVAAFAFQVTRVATEPVEYSTVETVLQAEDLVDRKDRSTERDAARGAPGPAARLLTATAVGPARIVAGNSDLPVRAEVVAAKLMSCLSHFAVVLGLVLLGRRHLGDIRLGIAMATLYLLLPCTAYQVNRVDHVLPSALVVWALTFYHRPMVAGCLMGLASGTVFFPAFLLPVWMGFYGRNGAIRFSVALAAVAAVLIGTIAFTAKDSASFLQQTIGSIDWSLLQFSHGQGVGFWTTMDSVYRIPMMAVFLVMVILLTIFPRKKNIEHLLAHSAAIVVATQLWYPLNGSVYVLWYLPLMLTVVFRPRLTHLVPPEAAPLLRLARERGSKSDVDRTFSASNRPPIR
ncbi:MAG: hypothetical protein ACYTGL_05055 [Planctomycetota bacterium]|jgi:hypothetical protein